MKYHGQLVNPFSVCAIIAYLMLYCIWAQEYGGSHYVLLCMWILHPNQASSLQGCHGVNHAILAVKNWGIGSGWQQSKQNSVLLAVVG